MHNIVNSSQLKVPQRDVLLNNKSGLCGIFSDFEANSTKLKNILAKKVLFCIKWKTNRTISLKHHVLYLISKLQILKSTNLAIVAVPRLHMTTMIGIIITFWRNRGLRRKRFCLFFTHFYLVWSACLFICSIHLICASCSNRLTN